MIDLHLHTTASDGTLTPSELVARARAARLSIIAITDHDTTTQTFVQADYSASFLAGGYHSLKIGGGVRRNENDVDRRYPGGSVDVFWDSTFTSSVAGVGAGRGAFGYYEVHDAGTFGSAAAGIARSLGGARSRRATSATARISMRSSRATASMR